MYVGDCFMCLTLVDNIAEFPKDITYFPLIMLRPKIKNLLAVVCGFNLILIFVI